MKAAVSAVSRKVGKYQSVTMAAHTGVAAGNMGAGACTFKSIFKLNAGKDLADLESDNLNTIVALFGSTRLSVLHEVSMISALQFEMVSRRLTQVARRA